MHFFNLRDGSGVPGADGPNRFIGYGESGHPFGWHIDKRSQYLFFDHVLSMTGPSFLQCFSHAENGSEVVPQRGFQFFIDLGVGFSQESPSFRMPDDDRLAAHVFQHTTGNLTRIGSFFFPGQVLRAQFERIAGTEDLPDAVKSGKRGHEQDFRTDVPLQGLPESMDKLDSLGCRLVHLPIACDESGLHERGDRKKAG